MATTLSDFLNNTGKLRESLRFDSNSEFEQTIIDWIKERQQVAEKILKDEDNYSTGALANSIEPKPFTRSQNQIIVEILANSYWDYINSGVNGVFRNRGSKYSFRNLGVGRDMQKSFKDFIKNRGIRQIMYRDSKGESKVKQLRAAKDFESAAFALAKATKKKGIEGSEFMDIAFSEDALKELSSRLEIEVVKIFA